MASIFCTTKEIKARHYEPEDYVTYKVVQKVADGFDSKNPTEFLIEEEVVEDTRVPIDDDINSHRDRVGLKNLLKGIVSEKQMSDLLERTRSSGLFVDATKIPDSQLEMEKLVGSIDSIWESIPAELRGSLSKEEFLKSITSKKIEDYVASQLEKQEAKEEVK